MRFRICINLICCCSILHRSFPSWSLVLSLHGEFTAPLQHADGMLQGVLGRVAKPAALIRAHPRTPPTRTSPHSTCRLPHLLQDRILALQQCKHRRQAEALGICQSDTPPANCDNNHRPLTQPQPQTRISKSETSSPRRDLHTMKSAFLSSFWENRKRSSAPRLPGKASSTGA
jgi:hypothetical protein